MKRVRHYIFLKDVFFLALTAFGGPQAHLALFFKILVKKRAYLTENELIDLNSFCQILPGPASTQTLTAVGFKIGGPRLAFLTLLVWIFPAVTIMTFAAIFLSDWANYTKYIQIIAVGFVIFASYKMSAIVIKSKISIAILIVSAVACYLVPSPAIFPLILIAGGLVTSLDFKKHPLEKQEKLKVEWANLILYAAIFIGAALIGHITRSFPTTQSISKGARIFENCFRNGSLTFGGGEALGALFYKQFVEFKHYLTREEFLSGYGILKGLPGPLFSFSSYIGSISMKEYGLGGQIIGSIVAAAGIFLPGTILIFFIIRFWDRFKTYRIVRASLEGVNAASAGIVTATAFILFQPLIQPGMTGIMNYSIAGITLCLLIFTKIPSPYLIIAGLVAGFIF